MRQDEDVGIRRIRNRERERERDVRTAEERGKSEREQRDGRLIFTFHAMRTDRASTPSTRTSRGGAPGAAAESGRVRVEWGAGERETEEGREERKGKEEEGEVLRRVEE